MPIRKHYISILILSLLSLPSAANANAGTPMMWAGMLHLALGNVVIGLIEGILLAWIFKVPRSKSVALMIAANYLSAGVGAFSLGFLSEGLSHSSLYIKPLYDAPKLLWASGVILFLATIVIEYPFCRKSLSHGKHNASQLTKRAMIASIIAQVVSYSLLVPYYMMASPISAITDVKKDPALTFAKDIKAAIYYISLDGDVYRINADGTDQKMVLDSNLGDSSQKLFVRKSSDSHKWDLWTRNNDNNARESRLIKEFASNATPTWYSLKFEGKESWAGFGNPSDFRPDTKRYWSIRTGYWAAEGLHAHNEKTGKGIHVALETPFLSWRARSATVLPSDQVVFQLGDQIVLLDLNSRKIGLLALGRGPVVVLD